MKTKLLILAVTVAVGSLLGSCRKDPTNASAPSSMEKPTPHLFTIDPSNNNNPYDFAGEYVVDALAAANGTTDEQDYKDELYDYWSTNSPQMFSDWSQLSSAESDLLKDLAVDFENASSLDDKTQVAIDYEDDVVASSSFNGDEKERLLYIISSVKHSYHFSETVGTTIAYDVAIDYLLDLMGYPELDPEEVEPQRKFWGWQHDPDDVVGKPGEPCYQHYFSSRYIFWIRIKGPIGWVDESEEVPCP